MKKKNFELCDWSTSYSSVYTFLDSFVNQRTKESPIKLIEKSLCCLKTKGFGKRMGNQVKAQTQHEFFNKNKVQHVQPLLFVVQLALFFKMIKHLKAEIKVKLI